MDTKNLPVVICYPPGAGGSMLGSALHSVFKSSKFNISNSGNCHLTGASVVPHYVPTSDMAGFKNEIIAIETLAGRQDSVTTGHIRNIVAMQSVNYQSWFIKIVFDVNCSNEIEFLHRMLAAKMPIKERLADCYEQIKLDHWPNSLDEFLITSNCEELFREQNIYTLKNWFWVESPLTRCRTIELSIQDIFLGTPGEKISCWYDKNTIDLLYPLIKNWQTINQKLYPDTMSLLTN
jgi:hypothetical protein